MCIYVCLCVHVCLCTLGWILLLLNDTVYVRVTFPAGGDLGGSTSYASIFLYEPKQVLLPPCSLYDTFLSLGKWCAQSDEMSKEVLNTHALLAWQ